MSLRTLRTLFGIALLTLLAACKQTPTCSEHFAQGQAPVIVNEKLETRTAMLCFEAYGVLHSGVSRTPLWSAEHLTAASVEQARGLKRKNTFHAEEKLPANDRAELRDYVRSGYDRGHMSPSGDMPTESAQYESFSLANMIPQNPNKNQVLWEGMEEATRNLARREGELYVVTGPIFEGTSLERLNGRVLVPTSIFKAIYIPSRQQAAAYFTANAPGMEYETLSIAELETRIGINVFPKLPPEVKEAKMELPTPTPRNFRKPRTAPSEPNTSTR
ncbi:DNA/RNA non-specific endonuclease [Noviherbaspirillum massiliense]|uniref:DNA/RNA non-specific endonuclease n=1 Tax=Noviherbaspirillum massiliense TaxID=1465823 RepID=UPI0002F476DF|nr:DNA/RNA non-specific endonuclease [Noviherbaspirillum massiliense]